MTSRTDDLDPRIARGTASMLAARVSELDAGAVPLGWKLGFGAPTALVNFALDRPLVGYLTRDRLLPDGARVEVGGWSKPLLEAEVAAHLDHGLGPGATPAQALAAVGGWSVAIELADLDHVPSDVERILAGNIFHRHVLLGPVVRRLPAGLAFAVRRDGHEVAGTAEPTELTGDPGAILAATAETLARCGSALMAGDVVITGSVVPPIDVSTGGSWHVAAPGLGEVSVEL